MNRRVLEKEMLLRNISLRTQMIRESDMDNLLSRHKNIEVRTKSEIGDFLTGSGKN
jgi:hypothetical protein